MEKVWLKNNHLKAWKIKGIYFMITVSLEQISSGVFFTSNRIYNRLKVELEELRLAVRGSPILCCNLIHGVVRLRNYITVYPYSFLVRYT